MDMYNLLHSMAQIHEYVCNEKSAQHIPMCLKLCFHTLLKVWWGGGNEPGDLIPFSQKQNLMIYINKLVQLHTKIKISSFTFAI